MSWADVPTERFGCSGVTAWRQLRDWTEAGVPPRLHEVILAELRKAGLLDVDDATVDGSRLRSLGEGMARGFAPCQSTPAQRCSASTGIYSLLPRVVPLLRVSFRQVVAVGGQLHVHDLVRPYRRPPATAQAGRVSGAGLALRRSGPSRTGGGPGAWSPYARPPPSVFLKAACSCSPPNRGCRTAGRPCAGVGRRRADRKTGKAAGFIAGDGTAAHRPGVGHRLDLLGWAPTSIPISTNPLRGVVPVQVDAHAFAAFRCDEESPGGRRGMRSGGHVDQLGLSACVRVVQALK
ncbi:hypothetical protein ACWD25_21855 [Streptomyces sp. NPDC002920]